MNGIKSTAGVRATEKFQAESNRNEADGWNVASVILLRVGYVDEAETDNRFGSIQKRTFNSSPLLNTLYFSWDQRVVKASYTNCIFGSRLEIEVLMVRERRICVSLPGASARSGLSNLISPARTYVFTG